MPKTSYTDESTSRYSNPDSPLKRSETVLSRGMPYNSILRIFGMVLLLVLVTSLIMKLQGNSGSLSFESFINFLATAPQISPSFAIIPKFTADIGIFQFFADFINYLGTIINILVFLFKNLANLVVYVVWFFGWVFSF